MAKFFVFFFLSFGVFYPSLYFADDLASTPEKNARQMQANLLLGDSQAASEIASSALKKFSDPLVFNLAIKSFAAAGAENEMLRVWSLLNTVDSTQALNQDLLEEMCWGILKKGKQESSLSIQLIALIGAALTHDARALPFLLDGMRHPNAQIREISVELAAHYGDYPLKKELVRLFQNETVLDVRLVLYRALGQLKMEEFIPELILCVANAKKGDQERLAAIEAIVQMRDQICESELQILATSERAGLRILACEVIAHCRLEHELLLVSLMQDRNPEVCAAALRAWGLLRKKSTPEIQKMASDALDPIVGITASWIWFLESPSQAEGVMVKWLEHPQAHVRALAASAISHCGSYGMEFALKMLPKSSDLFVKANLALALAGQREAVDQVCSILEECLLSPEKWMFSESHFFRRLEKSRLSHKPSIPNYPEVMNQMARLELLNLLAILDAPHALGAVKNFLKERKWSITGLAAETLLEEGDEQAIDLIRELLEDSDIEVRLEAALALATWGKDDSAIPILLKAYPLADRQLKLKILESLGRIGHHEIIPFLIERLHEPSLLLRMVAASVIIQALNH